jgi:hypothetical protein
MSVHKYSSYGRTRQPKSLGHAKRFHVTASQNIAELNKLGQDTSSFTPANGVYKTENQRYMHVAASGSSDVTGVFLYNHSMGYWHELVTGSANSSVVVGNNQHQVVEIYGADFVSLTGSHNGVYTIAFSTF